MRGPLNIRVKSFVETVRIPGAVTLEGDERRSEGNADIEFERVAIVGSRQLGK